MLGGFPSTPTLMPFFCDRVKVVGRVWGCLGVSLWFPSTPLRFRAPGPNPHCRSAYRVPCTKPPPESRSNLPSPCPHPSFLFPSLPQHCCSGQVSSHPTTSSVARSLACLGFVCLSCPVLSSLCPSLLSCRSRHPRLRRARMHWSRP